MQAFQEEDYTKRFDLNLWKKLLHIAKPFHKNLYLVGALMAISAILDVIFPLMTSYAIDNFIIGQATAGIPGFIALYLGLLAIQVISIFVFLRRAGMWKPAHATPSAAWDFRSFKSFPFPTMTACPWAT